MSSLFVLVFSSEGGAGRMVADLGSLQKEQHVTVTDAAILIRKRDRKIKVREANSLVRTGTLGGIFWGMLISQMLFMPWLGMVTGAVTDAPSGRLTDYGIADSFIKEVGITIRPGCSALFLLVKQMKEEEVIAALSRHRATLLQTNLGAEAETRLGEAFRATEVEL